MRAAGYAETDERMERLDPPLTIVFLGSRFVQSSCLVSALQSVSFGMRFQTHSSVADWLAVKSNNFASLVVIDQEQRSSDRQFRLSSEMSMLTRHSLEFAILSDFDDPCSAMEALRLGARGFIPANLPPSVVLQALRLIVAGGIFIPLTSLVLLLSQKSRPAIQMTLGHDDSGAIDVSAASALTKRGSDKHETRDLADDSSVRAHLMRLLTTVPVKGTP